MKKLLLFLSILLSSDAVFSQLTVDMVDSDSTVLHFVQQQNYDVKKAPQWKFFYLTNGDEWNSYYNLSREQQSVVAQQDPTLRWSKADINGDGKQDLVVSGYIARRPGDWSTATFKLLIFLSQPGTDYSEVDLIGGQQSAKFPVYFNIVKMDDKDLLRIYQWRNLSDSRIPLEIDTLKYNNRIDAFVNADQPLSPSDITQLQYRVYDDQLGSYHEALIVPKAGKAADLTISVKQYNDKTPQIYRVKIVQSLWMQIDTLARSLQLPKENNIFPAAEGSTQLPVELTLFYGDSSRKFVKDSNGEISYTFISLYQTMETIIQSAFDQIERRQEILTQMQQQQSGLDW